MWQRVTGMELQPNACVACGSNPVDQNGEQQEAIFAEGVDIDWGNSLYLCWDCANIVASLVGRVDKDAFDSLTQRYEALLEAHAELEEKHEHLEGELDKIREGSRAVKRVRETTRT